MKRGQRERETGFQSFTIPRSSLVPSTMNSHTRTHSHNTQKLIGERKLKLCESLGTDKHCAPVCHSYTRSSVFVCVRERVCLLAPVVWIGAARLDQQANHLPVYNSHPATLRCSQTHLFFFLSLTTLCTLSFYCSLSPFHPLSLARSHTQTQTHSQLGNSKNPFN